MGCGETVIATQPTPEELVRLQVSMPGALLFWHIKCSKCYHQTWLAEYENEGVPPGPDLP